MPFFFFTKQGKICYNLISATALELPTVNFKKPTSLGEAREKKSSCHSSVSLVYVLLPVTSFLKISLERVALGLFIR